ncbi:MAG: hypothetical protein E7534_00500 [Ruminococcaceae bacterium]|nr:hypothetical protein [Oscillospiraceae bacterium]
MKNRYFARRIIALACCFVMAIAMTGCGADDGGEVSTTTATTTTTAADAPSNDGGDKGTTAATGGTTTTTTGTTNVPTDTESKPNPPTRIPAAPDKPYVDPTTINAVGAPAPEWMREGEMYTHGTYLIPGDFMYDLNEWAPYFNFITGSAWNTDTNNTYRELGVKSDSYFDPYHVFSDHNITVMTARGEYVQSDYIEPGRNDLYVVCHNCPDMTLPWAYDYIDRAMSFGQTGMFFDDIRAPYESIAKAYNTCYSTNHKHTLTGTNTYNYFHSTLPAIYDYVKKQNPNFYVLLNGGNPMSPADDVSTPKTVWPFADALMWEHAIYDANTTKWCSWAMLKNAAEILKPGIDNGKVELLLSYSYNKMTKQKALDAVKYTLAYCRLYDYMWSDYNTLLTSPLGLDQVKEVYGTKTGPAGAYGVFYGRVVEATSGAAIAGVTVKAGNVKATTDDNGYFSIRTPKNTTTVTLTCDGYKTTSQRLTGYQDNLKMEKTSGKTYYVAPFGSNDNDGLSKATPWRSINNGDAKGILKPGDTVVLTEGTYSVPNQTVYKSSGTADAPITYIADGYVVVRTAQGNGSPFVLKGNYTVWDGIIFEGSQAGVKSLMTVVGNYNHIRNCEFGDTAFYNEANKLSAESAVTIRGENTKFHHNVLGSDVYASTALRVEAKSAEILHNTFDGTLTAGGKTKTALTLTNAGDSIVIKNNMFSTYDQAYANGKGATFAGNFFNKTSRDAACAGDKDQLDKDPCFMWQLSGDYDLKRTSPAVNAGVYAGFAYRGSAPDIGAWETAYNDNYDAVLNGRVMTRVFANTVVLLNTSLAEQVVSVPLGVSGAQLKEVLGDKIWTADGSGNLLVTVPADRALILVGVDK